MGAKTRRSCQSAPALRHIQDILLTRRMSSFDEGRHPSRSLVGRLEHAACDSQQKLLFVSCLGDDCVSVVDLHRGTLVGELPAERPRGILLVPKAQMLIVATCRGVDAWRCDSLPVSHGSDESIVPLDFDVSAAVSSRRKLFDAPDCGNLALCPRTGQLAVTHRHCITLLDVESFWAAANAADYRATVTATIVLPTQPEGFDFSLDGARLYANLPDIASVAVIVVDPFREAVCRPPKAVATTAAESGVVTIASLPASSSSVLSASPVRLVSLPRRHWDNFPLIAINGGFAVVTRKPACLLLFNDDDVEVAHCGSLVGDAEDLFFDQRRNRFYVIGGEGNVAAIQIRYRHKKDGRTHSRPPPSRSPLSEKGEPADYEIVLVEVETVTSSVGARTGCWSNTRDRLYVAAPESKSCPAHVMVFEAQTGENDSETDQEEQED